METFPFVSVPFSYSFRTSREQKESFPTHTLRTYLLFAVRAATKAPLRNVEQEK